MINIAIVIPSMATYRLNIGIGVGIGVECKSNAPLSIVDQKSRRRPRKSFRLRGFGQLYRSIHLFQENVLRFETRSSEFGKLAAVRP